MDLKGVFEMTKQKKGVRVGPILRSYTDDSGSHALFVKQAFRRSSTPTPK